MANNSNLENTVESDGLRAKAAKWMRVIGAVEALSLILLVFVAMPIKYIGHNETPVKIVGMAHGNLFLIYVVSVLAVARILQWRYSTVFKALVASVVPFGPFIFEAWLRRNPDSA